MPAKLPVTVKISDKYICNGSSTFCPKGKAGVGVVVAIPEVAAIHAEAVVTLDEDRLGIREARQTGERGASAEEDRVLRHEDLGAAVVVDKAVLAAHLAWLATKALLGRARGHGVGVQVPQPAVGVGG